MQVVLAAFLGFGAIFVAIASEMILGTARSPMTPVAFVIMGAYLAICEVFVAKKGVEPVENWATLLGMAAPPVLAWFVVIPLFEGHGAFPGNGIPGLLAGSIGPLVGVLAAWALPKNGSQS